jgi:O-antigen/teichoic acid export membrane protein
LTNFAISILISLFITPYIVNQLESEAHGFIGLANSFTSYASLATVALNSMAGRFISIEIYKNNYRAASKYYSSVFFSNLLLALLFVPAFVFVVFRLEHLIEIPTALVTDVKITFAITFLQYILSLLLSRYETATFVTNKLYLSQRNSTISSVLRLLIVVLCFGLFSTKVSYLALGYLVASLFVHLMNMYYSRKFIPDLKTQVSLVRFSAIRELTLSGIWNLLNKLSSILLDGLDLLITNVFIGSAEMGALSISKTIPALFMTLRGSLDYPFTPSITRCYAKGDIDGVVKYARFGNKLLGIFMIAPMAVFAVFGQSFFKLWVPLENSSLIQILSLLSIMSLISGACINSVFTIFSITNKLRANSIVIMVSGIITITTNFFLLKYTSLGVYCIAGVSSICSLLRNYIFTPLYGAHCLGVKKSTFYHEILTGNACLVLNVAIAYLIGRITVPDSWIKLILLVGISAIVCIAVNSVIVLSRSDKRAVFSYVKRFLNSKLRV